jgi:hypothetical protein
MIKFNKIILPFCNNWAERSGYNWNFYFNGTPEFKYFVSKYDLDKTKAEREKES